MEAIKPFCAGHDIVLRRKKILTRTPFSFSLPEGKFVALVGKNGAGKTTLLHAILGESYLASGSIYFTQNPTPTEKLSAKEISQIVSFVPQEHSYPSHFTGLELLQFSLLSKHGVFSPAPEATHPKIISTVETLDLPSLMGKPLSEMSSGERQKMFLGSALIKDPKVLLLDEPTNHLDPAATNAFWRALTHTPNRGSTILSTHDLPFIESYCDYVLVLDKGGLEFAGSTSEFTDQGIATKVFNL